jgi:hypothetical protein
MSRKKWEVLGRAIQELHDRFEFSVLLDGLENTETDAVECACEAGFNAGCLALCRLVKDLMESRGRSEAADALKRFPDIAV